MNFKEFLRRKRVDELRQQYRDEISSLGYTLVEGGNLASGERLIRGYTVVAPGGEILDNQGMGYVSSHQALTAVRRHAAADKPWLP